MWGIIDFLIDIFYAILALVVFGWFIIGCIQLAIHRTEKPPRKIFVRDLNPKESALIKINGN